VESVGEGHHFVILDFAVTLLDPDAEPAAGDDAAEAAWVPLHELAERQLVEGLAEFLHDHGIIETIL
jgi:ADP-ribose pyrophosphatase YjhB (NUDIX family)